MSKLTSHEVRLAFRPEGIPAATNFTLVRTELEPLQDGEVLVRNLFMSVDPYMRGRMNEGQSYVPPFELGKPLDGGAVGLPGRSGNDRHDRMGRAEFGGRRGHHLHLRGCRRSGQCGRTTGEVAPVPCCWLSRFGGKGPVSAGGGWI